MKPTDICNVTNRSAGMATYSLPEMHIKRTFRSGETKRIPYEEIYALAQKKGGKTLIEHCFFISNPEVMTELLNEKPEPEYYLTEDKIDEWMKTCSLDEFKDALDFAPNGVKSLIKKHAVSLPLNDLAKCQALKDQLGFDALKAIKIEQETVEDTSETTQKRRVVKEEEKPAEVKITRRATPKYNVVSTKE